MTLPHEFERCCCEVPMTPAETLEVRWCYREDCPHTAQRWPSERQIEIMKIEPKWLNRPGWYP